MYCNACGQPNPDSNTFCRNCGIRLNPTPQPLYSYSPTPDDNVRSTLRSLASRASLMTAIITFTAALALSLVGVFYAPTNLAASLNMILNVIDIPYTPEIRQYLWQLQDTLMQMSASSALSGVLGLLPQILMALGMWLAFANAKNGGSKTAGLTLNQVFVVIGLVGLYIGAALYTLAFVVLMVGMADYLEDVGVYLLIAFLSIAVVFLFAIVYNTKLNGIISRMKRTIVSGVPEAKISAFVAVILILSGIFGILTSIPAFLLGGFLSVASTMLSGISTLCFGIFLLGYRKAMRKLSAEQIEAPAYRPEVYAQPEQPAYQPPVREQPKADYSPASFGKSFDKDDFEPSFETRTYAQPDAAPAADLFGQTGELTSPAAPEPYLIRVKTGEQVSITSDTFVLGKGRMNADYGMDDNPTISRKHAAITNHGGSYFITDLGSRNGTSVDGTRITPNAEVPIRDGSRLILADEELVFHLG